MDWSNESYIRVYIRDTKSWLKLRWEGQCLFMMLLRKVDRSGILDDIEDPDDDLSLITGFPIEHVRSGLSRLVKLGIVRINTDNTLLIPNFIEAQEATKSDKQRQREFRERRRLNAKNVTNRYSDEIKRNEKVTAVNESQRESTDVNALLYCADPVPCSAVPNGAMLDMVDTPVPVESQKQLILPKKPKPRKKAKSTETWNAYSTAYTNRYGEPPPRNAKQNSLCCQLVDRLGATEAPQVAAYYLNSRNQYHVQRGHSLQALVGDCESLRTAWKTGNQITQTQAREDDRLHATGAGWERVKAELGEG
jgi:hypothetical protein